jgi:hypothetical protein
VTSRLPHFLDKRLKDGGEVVSLTHRPSFTPTKIVGTIPVRDWVNLRAIMWLEGLSQLKNPMATSGLEPATFWLVA